MEGVAISMGFGNLLIIKNSILKRRDVKIQKKSSKFAFGAFVTLTGFKPVTS